MVTAQVISGPELNPNVGDTSNSTYRKRTDTTESDGRLYCPNHQVNSPMMPQPPSHDAPHQPPSNPPTHVTQTHPTRNTEPQTDRQATTARKQAGQTSIT